MNEGQYDRIARYLDGEAVELTDQERLALDEIASLEDDVRCQLDIEIPRGVVSRVGQRLARATAHTEPIRLHVWWGRRLAIAAALLLALGGAWWLGRMSSTPAPSPRDLAKKDIENPSRGGNPEWRAEILTALIASDRDPELDMMTAELSEMEGSVATWDPRRAGPEAVDPGLDHLERDLGDMLREDAEPFLPQI